jgi:hypothetical protein
MKQAIEFIFDNVHIIIAVATFLIVLFFVFFGNRFCVRHFCFKPRIFVSPEFTFIHCEKCVAEDENPKVKCSCGWKGRFLDLEEYTYWDDTITVWHCPKCEKEIKAPL